MPLSLLLSIGYKVLLPALLLVVFAAVSYNQGRKSVQTLWDARELALTIASTEALLLGKQRELSILTELTAVKSELTKTAEKDDEIISNLTSSNRKLLATRLRRGKTSNSSSCPLPNHPSHAEGTTDARDYAYWTFPVGVGEAIITTYELADRVNSSRNSCIVWVKALEKKFGAGTGVIK